jgi:hypothetical protein
MSDDVDLHRAVEKFGNRRKERLGDMVGDEESVEYSEGRYGEREKVRERERERERD